MLFDSINSLLLSYNQTDRIQGMARYMNREGASSDWVMLLSIFLGMVTVILVLKMVASSNQKKRQAQIRKKMQQRKKAATRQQAAESTKSRRRATRLR